VAVFPEGTTGPGDALLPFHANLLQAAIATTTPVQPVALRYGDRAHAYSRAAQWLGDTSMLQSLWALACADGLVAHLAWLPAQATAHADRRALAQRLHDEIAVALHLHPSDPSHPSHPSHPPPSRLSPDSPAR
jgi:1-acyl-sn-glycerol-3-phosphate acyltransferase